MQFFLHYMCSVDDIPSKSKDDLIEKASNSSSSSFSVYTPTTYIVKNNRIPIFFNFKIANSIVLNNGSIEKWYYSDQMGQIMIKENAAKDWSSLISHEGSNKQEQATQSTPSLITYRSEETGMKIIKDIMSN